MDPKVRNKKLVEEFEWDAAEAKKIWSFGPDASGPNMLVDVTKQAQYLNEVRDHMLTSFNWVAKEGVLSEENLRGVRFNVEDVQIHADAPHRGNAQIVPAARRVFFASQLSAAPRFQEPIFLAEIQCPETCKGAIYQLISARRGEVIEEAPIGGTPLVTMKAYLPVKESFGFSEALRVGTKGRAFPQMVFDHWHDLPGDPLGENNPAADLVQVIRKRKGLPGNVPSFDTLHDKL